MRDKRFQFGVIVTAVWLGIMFGVVVVSARPEKLNEWGDFFAGFFAPLAFMWLVIGYMQQGEELRQSSEALRLQAEELRNSVEQQSQLVEVSRKQLEQEADALRDERLRRDQAARPVFILECPSYNTGQNSGEYTFQLTNTGNTATGVEASISVGDQETRVAVGMMQRHQSRDLFRSLELQYAVSHVMTVEYVDSDGNDGVQSLTVRAERQGPVFKDVFEVVL